MHVFRQRAKAHGKRVEFANDFCVSAELPYVFMGYVNTSTRKIMESWFGRRQPLVNECISDLIKSIELRLALHFSISPALADDGSQMPADIMQDDIIWIDAGPYRIGIGEFVGQMAPVIAFRHDSSHDQPARQALFKIGMAYVLQQLTQRTSLSSAWQEGVLEAATRVLSIDIVVVSETGEIVHDGRRRKRSQPFLPGLKIVDEQFVADFSTTRTELQAAISAATSLDKKTSIVSIANGENALRFLLVTPLVNSSSPLALIVLEREEVDHAVMREHIFDIYGLTPSERLVAHGIIGGQTVAETAQATSLSVATVRSYMKQIFAKTNTHRQCELITLYYSSILPMASGVGSLGEMRH